MSAELTRSEERLVELLAAMGTVGEEVLDECVDDVLCGREAGHDVELGQVLVKRGHVSETLIKNLLGSGEDQVFAGEAGEYEGVTPDPEAVPARRVRASARASARARRSPRSGQGKVLVPSPDPDEPSSLPEDVETRRFDLEALAAASAQPAPPSMWLSPHILGGVILVVAMGAIGGVASLQRPKQTIKPPRPKPPTPAVADADPFDDVADVESKAPMSPLAALGDKLYRLELEEDYPGALKLLATVEPELRAFYRDDLADAERRLKQLERHRVQVKALLKEAAQMHSRAELEAAVARLTSFAGKNAEYRDSPSGVRLDDTLFALGLKLDELRSIPVAEIRTPTSVVSTEPAERAARFASEAERGRQIVQSIKEAIVKDTEHAARAHVKEVAEARKRSEAEPLEVELLPNYRLRGAVVEDFNDVSFTVLNRGDRLTYAWDSIDPAVAYEIRQLAVREGEAEDQLRLGRWCLERRLFEEARQAFGRAVMLNPRLKDQIPDVAAVSRSVRIFAGSLSRSASSIAVTYDFTRANEGGDWELPSGARGGVDTKAGRFHLSGKGIYLATFKEVGFKDRLSVHGVIGPMGKGSSAVLGVSFGSGARNATTYLASVAQGSGDVLLARQQGGKVKVLERRKGAARGKGVRLAVEVSGERLRVRVGSRTVCRASVESGWERTRVHAGGASNAKGGAAFDEIVVRGRVRSAWLRKAFGEFDAVLAAILAQSEDLRVFARPPGKPARRPLSAEDAYGMRGVSREAKDEYTAGRLKAERRGSLNRLAALSALGNAIEQAPTFAAAYYRRARVLAQLGRIRPALADLGLAIKHCPRFFEAYTERARILALQGQLADARRDVDKALAERPDYAEAFSARALISFNGGDLEAAVDDLDMALALDPWSDEVRSFRRNVGNAIKGPPWQRTHQKETEHYVVRTNISARRCEDYAQELEAIRGFYTQQFGTAGAKEDAKKAVVLIFDTREGFQSYAQLTTDDRVESLLGCFLPRYRQLLIYEDKDDASLEETRRVLYHEAFHQFISTLIPDMPFWLNEGFADYFSTAKVEAGRVTGRGAPIGGRLRDLRRFVKTSGQVPFSRIMQETPAEFYSGSVGAKYAQAWSMVHFFIHGASAALRKRFVSYVKLLRQAKGNHTAFKRAWDGVAWPAVEAAWRAHVQKL